MKKSVKTYLGIIFFTFMFLSSNAQEKLRHYLIIGSASFVSGMLDGTVETLSWHYEQGFKSKFPHASDQFWNPELSWKNKYKNGNVSMGPKFLGSTTVFAFTTDGYHLLRTCSRAINTVTLACYANSMYKSNVPRKKKWKVVARDFLILTAIRSAGFTLTYSLIFRKDPKCRI